MHFVFLFCFVVFGWWGASLLKFFSTIIALALDVLCKRAKYQEMVLFKRSSGLQVKPLPDDSWKKFVCAITTCFTIECFILGKPFSTHWLTFGTFIKPFHWTHLSVVWLLPSLALLPFTTGWCKLFQRQTQFAITLWMSELLLPVSRTPPISSLFLSHFLLLLSALSVFSFSFKFRYSCQRGHLLTLALHSPLTMKCISYLLCPRMRLHRLLTADNDLCIHASVLAAAVLTWPLLTICLLILSFY